MFENFAGILHANSGLPLLTLLIKDVGFHFLKLYELMQ